MRLIERKISERQKVYLDLIPYVLGMFIFGIICWKSFDQALSAWEVNQRMSGLLRIPTWPAKSDEASTFKKNLSIKAVEGYLSRKPILFLVTCLFLY